MKGKKMIIFLVALVVEVIITYAVAAKFSVRFIEVMFFIGLAFTALSFYFSSSGGTTSDFGNLSTSAQTGLIQKRQEFIFRRGPIFTASALFMGIGLIFFILLVSGKIPPA
ncbi:hypothetical protein DRW41_04215 [Neobacillus piezotolerans]|uniref:DUF3899 domain-containing protein n=1 Tax=Neobacillus piezotolerans TaxID=2259171 RepID=A0A3D8GX55_9BACI|nr:hypothetical protein [Neobacillus piezotolerans]RDU38771.1 hypothetical protein DRW41_04215 [Neobacillus piezotolerans]